MANYVPFLQANILPFYWHFAWNGFKRDWRSDRLNIMYVVRVR